MATAAVGLASVKQAAFVEKLAVEREGGKDALNFALAKSQVLKATELDWKTVSHLIKALLAAPKVASAKSVVKVTEDGIYLLDYTVYKVQKAVHGSGNLYAKVLVVTSVEDGKKKGHFDYAPGAIKNLMPQMKMDYDQAVEFGALYGVCCNCGRTLTADESIAAGIGPYCAKKFQ